MTKRDYILMSNALRSSRPYPEDNDRYLRAFDPGHPSAVYWTVFQWRNDVHKIAEYMQQQNHSFNRAMFLRACGDVTQ